MFTSSVTAGLSVGNPFLVRDTQGTADEWTRQPPAPGVSGGSSLPWGPDPCLSCSVASWALEVGWEKSFGRKLAQLGLLGPPSARARLSQAGRAGGLHPEHGSDLESNPQEAWEAGARPLLHTVVSGHCWLKRGTRDHWGRPQGKGQEQHQASVAEGSEKPPDTLHAKGGSLDLLSGFGALPQEGWLYGKVFSAPHMDPSVILPLTRTLRWVRPPQPPTASCCHSYSPGSESRSQGHQLGAQNPQPSAGFSQSTISPHDPHGGRQRKPAVSRWGYNTLQVCQQVSKCTAAQAGLGDNAGSLPDHHDQVTVTVKRVT